MSTTKGKLPRYHELVKQVLHGLNTMHSIMRDLVGVQNQILDRLKAHPEVDVTRAPPPPAPPALLTEAELDALVVAANASTNAMKAANVAAYVARGRQPYSPDAFLNDPAQARLRLSKAGK